MKSSSPKSAATANNLLSAAETLELLGRLRAAVRDIAGRSQQAEADFAARANRLRGQFEERIAAERERWSSAIDAEKAAVETRRAHEEERFNARRERISSALENAQKRRLAQVEADETTRTAQNQEQIVAADRHRDAANEQNRQTRDAFLSRLTAECAEIQELESRARWSVGRIRQKEVPLDTSADESKLIEQIPPRLAAASRHISRGRLLVLPMLFRIIPVWVWLLAIVAAAFAFVPELQRFDFAAVPQSVWKKIEIAAGAVVAAYIIARLIGFPSHRAATQALNEARRLCDACAQKVEARFANEAARIEAEHVAAVQALNQEWKRLYAGARSLRRDWTGRLIEKAHHLNTQLEERHRHRLSRLQPEHEERLARLHQEASARTKQMEAAHAKEIAELNALLESTRAGIRNDWQARVLPLVETLRSAGVAADASFPQWRAELWKDFHLPYEFAGAARFGELSVDLEKLCEVSLSKTGLPKPAETAFNLPMLVTVPRYASVLFETKQSGEQQVIGTLNNLVLRLLTSSPPGRLAFTILDPVGLGQNFAGIMHLADFEERLIGSRIWTQQAQIEERLGDLSEHIEKVTQMYLRNEYETLAEYNRQAGRMAEKYHFLVIADFPTNFSEVAIKRLHSIAASGPRCGVHLLMHWDTRKPAPVEFVPEELRKNALCIVPRGDGFAVASFGLDASLQSTDTPPAPPKRGADAGATESNFPSWEGSGVGSSNPLTWPGLRLTLDSPPDAELTTKLLMQIGKDSTDAYRVEMPFIEAAPSDGEMWSLDTTNELRVPIGRTGATKLQYLSLGQGTRQHGLIAGKTGSGKSTLFHVIITNLSLWCSPEQVEFYLVDFKKGVEFKAYATHKLPHARVIAIESDREFGLSVLQRVDEELKRRGDLFRKLGAQDLAGYKRAGGNEPMPRVLLLIDEFQELFVEDDRVSQGAALLLDRIVRQGRAFGIHVLLGSQTLGGAYSLARATIGQMVVRIALQCNEADAYLIMSEDNPAPRLLSRPGEAIYNDDGGSVQGNSPFQVVWLPDRERDEWLEKVRKLTEQKGPTPAPSREGSRERRAGIQFPSLEGAGVGSFARREPIVFEGNAPSSVRDNPLLRELLDASALQAATSPRAWLGAPNSIKGPTEAIFHRQSGNHLLIVGQREENALAMLGISMISIAAQTKKDAARFLIFDSSPPDSPELKFLERVIRSIPHEAKIVRPGDIDAVMSELAAEQQKRADEPDAAAPSTFLLVHGLQRNKKLRFDEEMAFSVEAESGGNPGLQFNKLITEGAGLGFHVIATCDTYNNVMRFISRKALSEFEMRVLFQMSANDSASLIDSPAANNLGLHRAVLFNGKEGWLETFRPYALPEEAWLDEVGKKLRRLHDS